MSADDRELRVAWQRHIGASHGALVWFESVVARHRSADRHYHGIGHIVWVTRHLTRWEAELDDPAAVHAAGFFHDAVYDAASPAGSDEAASADLAARALVELGWESGRVERVASMIRATTDHLVPSVDRDHDALLAADLAVLATPPGRYADYVRNVRREYAHLGDDAWRAGRSSALRRFVERPHLFSPRLDLADWERRARANIAAELAGLADR